MTDEITQPIPSPIEKWQKWLPLLIFVAALAIRLWGIGWGLPNEQRHWSYHPDEPLLFSVSRGVEPARLDFEPGFYNYGTLYLTVLRIGGDIAMTYGGGDKPWEQMAAVHLAGRLISALAGAGTALLIFLMLRRRFGDFASVFGSLLVSFAPGFVIHSRFQTVDVMATFFLTASAYHALKLLSPQGGDKRTTVWSGIFAGLSAGTKYTGILGLVTLVVALALSKREDRGRLIATGVATSLLVLLITTPGIVLNFPIFWKDFSFEIQHSSQGHGLVFSGLPNGFLWHLYNLMVGVGPVLVGLGLIGLAVAAAKKDHAAWAIGAFFLLYYILIGRAEVLFLRYTFPLLIGLAFGLTWLINWSRDRRFWDKAIPALSIAGAGGLFGGGLAASAVSGLWMSSQDPRDEAMAYLKSASSDSTVVGLVEDPWYYTPPLIPDSGMLRGRFEVVLSELAASSKPRAIRYVPENPDERFDWDVRLLDQKPDYVVFSSFETEGYSRLRNRQNLEGIELLFRDRYVAFTERLTKEYELDRIYGGTNWGIHDLEYIRPLIWIWKRRGQ